MFDLENLGKGHGVHHSQWSHSMAHINIYRRHNLALSCCSHRFPDIKNCYVGSSHGVQHSQRRHLMASTDVLLDDNSNVYSISHQLRDIRKSNKMTKFGLENEGQGQGEENRDLSH